MATNNAVNLKSSGIASYDGAGTFSALANPLTVSNGGTGDSSLTAYAVLCGGTTSTAAVQSIAGVGTAGQVLTSNGAGALPTFQTAAAGSGYALFFMTESATPNPADSQTYFLALNLSIATSTASGPINQRLYIPLSGTITKIYGNLTVTGTLGSSENSTFAIRLNNSSDTTVTTTLKMNAANVTFNNTALSIGVSGGDYIEFKITTPAWATNPTQVGLTFMVLIT